MGGQSDAGEGSCDEVTIKNSDSKVKKGPYICHYLGCESSFKKPSRLKQHICSHTGERPYKCTAPNCDKAYTHACHLKRHAAKVHNPHLYKETYRCPYSGCGFQAAYKYNLRRHFQRKHEKIFSCTECEEKFTKNHLLRAHTFSHTGESPFRCGECSISFHSEKLLHKHQKGHKVHDCKFHGCEQQFKKWSDLRKHIREIHPCEYFCDTCEKKFKSKTNLKQHIYTHLKDRPTFPCPFQDCSRKYSRNLYLQHHIKWFHEGTSRHRCTFDGCDRVLCTKAKLLKHLEWHRRDHSVPKEIKKGKFRRERRDKGVSRRSMAASLSGIPPLPLNLEKKIIHGQSLESSEEDEVVNRLTETSALEKPNDVQPSPS